MTRGLLKVMILAFLLGGQTVPARADDWVPPARNSASPPATVSLPATQQGTGSFAPQTAPTWDAGTTWQNVVPAPQGQWSRDIYGQPQVSSAQSPQPTAPAYNGAARLPMARPATPIEGTGAAAWVGPGQAVNGGPAAGLSSANAVQPPPGNWLPSANPYPQLPTPNVQPPQFAAPASNGVARLPMAGTATSLGGVGTAAALPSTGQGVDGTWREDGRYVIINIDGKETKLLKPTLDASHGAVARQPTEEGTVRGRLAQGQRPLANCHVALVPIKEAGKKTYVYDEAREPLTAITDSDGNYYFDHAPVGQYKLTWLPEGTRQWIRRLVIKPDVTVHGGQAVIVKEISFAQSTIN
jgi:hypothetical protein